MKVELITQIKSTYTALTKSEQKVGDYILNNLNKISYISVSQLAMECLVGEATILRFCRKLGYSGFYEFKRDVIEKTKEIDKPKELTIEDETYTEIQTMLDHTFNLGNEDVIESIAQKIIEAENIYIFGLGLSNICAKAAETRLAFLGYKAYSFEDQFSKIVRSNLVTHKDVVIGLSVSGSSAETIKNIKNAKNHGATIVGITNHSPSPLADLSDYVLLSASKELLDNGTTLVTLTSQIFIIERLCKKILGMDKTNVDMVNQRIFKTYE